jgi:hypothetical protein
MTKTTATQWRANFKIIYRPLTSRKENIQKSLEEISRKIDYKNANKGHRLQLDIKSILNLQRNLVIVTDDTGETS